MQIIIIREYILQGQQEPAGTCFINKYSLIFAQMAGRERERESRSAVLPDRRIIKKIIVGIHYLFTARRAT